MQPLLAQACWETLIMVGWSTLIAVAGGLPLGVLLVLTDRGGLLRNAPVNKAVGVVVNLGRSLPFLILMIAIIPFTRFVVGTSAGWQAAVVPLTVGAIPFYARLVETSLREVPNGKVEAAQMMGASDPQIVRQVLLAEAAPGLVACLTTTVIALVSYTAMAGAVGGGGLGATAMSYGYNRFQSDVMIAAVVLLVVIVQLVQVTGDLFVRRIDHR
jgi:D-methionine transport system permease protein